MKSRPILFSAPMVRAILDSSKTQTRRIVKGAPDCPNGWYADAYNKTDKWTFWGPRETEESGKCALPMFKNPYGQVGDQLWVRETWAIASKATDLVKVYYAASEKQSHTEFHEYFPVELAKDMSPTWPKYRPSIHMPRWASRITLEITGVRVERLLDISEEDSWAEGINAVDGMFDQEIYAIAKRMGRSFEESVPTYAALWESINGVGSWDENPWVWVINFRRLDLSERIA